MNPFKKALSKESTAGVIFTLPFTIGFLLFMIVPMGISLYYSFCDYDILSPPEFTGLDNFVKMFQDEHPSSGRKSSAPTRRRFRAS